jgi:hypothetical protein
LAKNEGGENKERCEWRYEPHEALPVEKDLIALREGEPA